MYLQVVQEIRHNKYVRLLNNWCSGLFTDIVGSPITPHRFRSARASHLVVEEGKSIETAQKLLGHESSETTAKHYVIRDDWDDAFDAFV